MSNEQEKINNIMKQAGEVFCRYVIAKDETTKKAILTSFQDQIDALADEVPNEALQEALKTARGMIEDFNSNETVS